MCFDRPPHTPQEYHLKTHAQNSHVIFNAEFVLRLTSAKLSNRTTRAMQRQSIHRSPVDGRDVFKLKQTYSGRSSRRRTACLGLGAVLKARQAVHSDSLTLAKDFQRYIGPIKVVAVEGEDAVWTVDG